MGENLIAKKTRGPNKQAPWVRSSVDGLSVLRLALDTHDAGQRDRLEAIFDAAFKIRRALQRDARDRVIAYWAAPLERERSGAKSVRERLGLSRDALERAAYAHLDTAPHLRRFATKALVMHLADSVWSATERCLFADASGKRQGLLQVGRWFDFRRIPGRARSHTRPRKWETFRLHGSLAGHRTAYTTPDGRFFQPRRMRAVSAPAEGWWSQDGPFSVVFTGLPGGEFSLPVRLPASPSNQPILDHHLSDPARWHKIDLVRRRDANAPGGWRYEAHLMVLAQPYASPTTALRREVAARETADRVAGIDVNVSNVTVASHASGADLRVTRLEKGAEDSASQRSRAARERRRNRRLDRSRRAVNPEQYEFSARQIERARRRAAAGLLAQKLIPRGARRSRADGTPNQAFRNDRLSERYRRERAAKAQAAAAKTQARQQQARSIAGAVVLQHGFRAFVEDCNLSAWARHWGRSLSTFAPGGLLSALDREMAAVAAVARTNGSGLFRVPTATTALSQHCLCGARVSKSLGDRVHACDTCGLRGDRDAVSATLAAFIEKPDPTHGASAFVDFANSSAALGIETRKLLEKTIHHASRGRQDARSESNAHSGRERSLVTEEGPTPVVMAARRIAGNASRTTPNETGSTRRTKSERPRETVSLPRVGQLRDSS